MKKEDIQFEIDQLRKDKIIYAVESCAVTLACGAALLFLPGLTQVIPAITYEISGIISMLIALIAIGYALFMGIGNYHRLQRIKELEHMLKNK